MLQRYQHSYHPVIPLGFHLSILPDQMLARIPRSTRHYWKNKDVKQLFGYEHCIKQSEVLDVLHAVALNKRLLAVNRALLRVTAVNRFIERNVGSFARKNTGTLKVMLENFQKIVTVVGFPKALRLCNLSYSKFLNWKNTVRCASSPFRLCRRKHPAQLLAKEANTIVSVCNDPAYAAWPLASIYHQAVRQKLIACSLCTFYKYAAILVKRKPLLQNRRKNHCPGIRANAPLEIIHADITQFQTADERKAYIYFIQDNFSRAVLEYKVTDERKAVHTLELIKKTYDERMKQQMGTDCSIVTDDGCENKLIASEVSATKTPSLVHLIAQKDICFSNSMIEHLNKTIKYRYLYQQAIANMDVLKRILDAAVIDYNNRPAHVLNDLTPLQALENQKVDSQRIKEQIRIAAQNRIQANKSGNCCVTAS